MEQQLAEVTQGNQNVSEFFTTIKTIWDGITDANPLPYCTCTKCTCNLTQRIQQRQQEQRLLQFMMKLNENYATVGGNILMMTPFPNVSQAYRLFAQEERYKEIAQSTTTESMAFLVDRRRNTHGFRNYQDKNDNSSSGNLNTGNYKQQLQHTGSFTSGIKRTGGKSRSHYYCTHCKILGHSVDRCYKIHGFPPGFKGNKENRVVAFAHNSNEEDSIPLPKDDNGGTTGSNNNISVEQYNSMMEMLNRQKLNEDSTTENAGNDHAALLTGKTCLLVQILIGS